MLRWALTFFMLSLVAAMLGFAGLTATSLGIAKTLFYLFVVAFFVTLVFGLSVSRRHLT